MAPDIPAALHAIRSRFRRESSFHHDIRQPSHCGWKYNPPISFLHHEVLRHLHSGVYCPRSVLRRLRRLHAESQDAPTRSRIQAHIATWSLWTIIPCRRPLKFDIFTSANYTKEAVRNFCAFHQKNALFIDLIHECVYFAVYYRRDRAFGTWLGICEEAFLFDALRNLDPSFYCYGLLGLLAELYIPMRYRDGTCRPSLAKLLMEKMLKYPAVGDPFMERYIRRLLGHWCRPRYNYHPSECAALSILRHIFVMEEICLARLNNVSILSQQIRMCHTAQSMVSYFHEYVIVDAPAPSLQWHFIPVVNSMYLGPHYGHRVVTNYQQVEQCVGFFPPIDDVLVDFRFMDDNFNVIDSLTSTRV
uniref:Uncharacterized protein n=1 Tax=Octactis speculum TaxID=3111310 RepID=A0A7S2CMK5_9STRA|mmetsp:Transcript_37057/g.50145  ORF Transcript_37057/g.50145 Transcript_37057/m.50145 type:complete len:360 (+) Transcript_37057:73-1152(+)